MPLLQKSSSQIQMHFSPSSICRDVGLNAAAACVAVNIRAVVVIVPLLSGGLSNTTLKAVSHLLMAKFLCCENI
jgi:hypothetical protein